LRDVNKPDLIMLIILIEISNYNNDDDVCLFVNLPEVSQLNTIEID